MATLIAGRTGCAVITVLLIVACCTAPVIAATRYIDSSPDLSAAISGINEFSPGQDATISIVVQNNGLNTYKFVDWGTIEPDDLPNTAKLVTIWVESGNAPIIIKTDPQRVGDIKGTGTVTVKVNAKILNNATEGRYELPLIIRYKYLASSDQEARENIQFLYKPVTRIIPLVVKIKPRVDIEVLEVTPGNLNVGMEGYLDLRIKNIGSEDGKQATVKITRNGASPVIPTDTSVFVGDFPQGEVMTCRYKVAVSGNAEKQTYPLDVAVTYKNNEGTVVTSSPYTIGIPVGAKTEFLVASAPPQVTAGSKGVILVDYQNAGDTTVYNAQARITAVDPFSSSDDTAYLGNMEPGETATARYDVQVDRAAEPTVYAFDSKLRYRDALGNSQISDMVTVTVQVVPAPSGTVAGLPVPLFATGIIIIVIAAGTVVLAGRYRKGKQ
ncbi:MAG: S-layer protein [Methanoregula sp.]|nr:MAG: S-layer protein [Methanoregula sp.]